MAWALAALAISAFVAAPTTVAAQTPSSTEWEVTVGGGVEEVASRDEAGSPLAYYGMGYPVGLRVDARGQRWAGGARTGLFFFGFNGGRLAADMATDGEPSHRADSVFVDLAGWLDRQVLELGGHRLAVGGQLSHWTFFRSYLYNPAQIGSVEAWDATISADVRASIDGHTGAMFWGLSAAVPVAGWVIRPSYAVRGDERVDLVDSNTKVVTHGRLTTVHRLQMFQTEATLGLRLGQRWSLQANYRLGRLSYTNELQTRAFSQRAMLGVGFRF